MHIETVITLEDLQKVLAELSPLRIHIGGPDQPERWIELDPPQAVRLERGVGARVTTRGRFRYTKGGVPVAADIREVELRLEPRVVDDGPEGLRLAFAIEIERGDLVMVPDAIDDGIVALVNRALTPRDTKLSWRFSDTLAADLPLTPRMQPVDRLTTRVAGAEVKVDEAEVRFRVRIRPAFHRGGALREQPTA